MKVKFPSGLEFDVKDCTKKHSATRTDSPMSCKRTRGGVLFYDDKGEAFCFLRTNERAGEYFFVTATFNTDINKIWYMYGVTSETEDLLGIERYMVSCETATQMAKQINKGE
jgi:hypothetical protein